MRNNPHQVAVLPDEVKTVYQRSGRYTSSTKDAILRCRHTKSRQKQNLDNAATVTLSAAARLVRLFAAQENTVFFVSPAEHAHPSSHQPDGSQRRSYPAAPFTPTSVLQNTVRFGRVHDYYLGLSATCPHQCMPSKKATRFVTTSFSCPFTVRTRCPPRSGRISTAWSTTYLWNSEAFAGRGPSERHRSAHLRRPKTRTNDKTCSIPCSRFKLAKTQAHKNTCTQNTYKQVKHKKKHTHMKKTEMVWITQNT